MKGGPPAKKGDTQHQFGEYIAFSRLSSLFLSFHISVISFSLSLSFSERDSLSLSLSPSLSHTCQSTPFYNEASPDKTSSAVWHDLRITDTELCRYHRAMKPRHIEHEHDEDPAADEDALAVDSAHCSRQRPSRDSPSLSPSCETQTGEQITEHSCYDRLSHGIPDCPSQLWFRQHCLVDHSRTHALRAKQFVQRSPPRTIRQPVASIAAACCCHTWQLVRHPVHLRGIGVHCTCDLVRIEPELSDALQRCNDLLLCMSRLWQTRRNFLLSFLVQDAIEVQRFVTLGKFEVVLRMLLGLPNDVHSLPILKGTQGLFP